MSALYYIETLAAGYLALTLILYMLSIRLQTAGFYARLLVSYVALLACATYGVFISLFLRLFGYGGNAQWFVARAFKYIMLYSTGASFTVEDPHNYLSTTRPAVIIGNHQTELDVLMLGCVFPPYCTVTAKSSLKRVPFLGWFMALSGTVFIDRKNSTSARQAMAGAAEEIKKHQKIVYMFPEGTRSYAKEPMLLPFKKGAFHLALQAGVPIIPVVVANYSHILYVQDRKFVAGSIPCKVLKPIETKHLKASDVDDLARDTRELMLREMVSLTAKARGEPVAMPAENPIDGVVKASGVEATAS
ncbi:putative 1-acyl-sn-glycerol-3-phosphate acyltransferase [Lachnellula subtilissima]|uniref:1-acyl-sn-glycerol-3-phosphate acyltransferase n=1 Tax=Lachnellula subtilissima TaxID=602034 RepID=A0A8H8RD93_9HELO|nr:putative 1-acyl-sn-glycerol-3-phosphate acyltransferase [Lachnellula subtilissima]